MDMPIENQLRGDAPARDHGALAGFYWALARDLQLAFRSRAELGVQLLFSSRPTIWTARWSRLRCRPIRCRHWYRARSPRTG